MDFTEIKSAIDEMADAAASRFDTLEKKLAESEDRADRLEAAFRRPGFGDNLDTKSTSITVEHKAFGKFIKTGDESGIKSLSAGSDPDGGYVVDTNLQHTINQKIFDQSPIRQLARVITLANGADWEEPQDVSDIGAEWVGETQSRPETTGASLKLKSITPCEIYASQVVTQKLLDLSFVDIGGWIAGKISDKFARSEGQAYINGTGVGQPRGMMTYAAEATTDDDTDRDYGVLQHVVSGSADSITSDSLKAFYWKLRAPYRTNSTWIMSSATASILDRLKDGDGRYLWRDGIASGTPPTLLGRPVAFDENMPAVAGGAFPIAFGDFRRGYTVCDWAGVRSLRDPYSSKPNVIYYCYKRTGGDVVDSDAIKLLKVAAS
jgi:HK97 family phage major capsid protein